MSELKLISPASASLKPLVEAALTNELRLLLVYNVPRNGYTYLKSSFNYPPLTFYADFKMMNLKKHWN